MPGQNWRASGFLKWAGWKEIYKLRPQDALGQFRVQKIVCPLLRRQFTQVNSCKNLLHLPPATTVRISSVCRT
jgi:hypothetical protein